MLPQMAEGEQTLPVADVSPTLDNDAPAEPASSTAKEPLSAERSFLDLPLDMFVMGGTHTSGHDRMMQSMEADAEKRRAEYEDQEALARKYGPQAGNPNEVANFYRHQFTEHPEVRKAYVPLFYMGRGGKEVEHEGVGDIIMVNDPAFPEELALLIFCPQCKDRGLPASQCILTIRQSNRRWSLDTRKAGELFVDPDGIAQRSAGEVMDSERFVCARCDWAACIDKNRVIPR